MPQLPRDGYYSRRPGSISDVIIHNTGGQEDIQADNDYHRFKAVWDKDDPNVHAPHIAYHLWLPYDPVAFLSKHGLESDSISPSVVVWCNHLWERSWHATNANDVCVGIALQLDGESQEPSEAQKTGVSWLIDEFLPDQGVVIPRKRVWGHGECSKVYGGGPDWGNNTVCPGKYVLPWVREFRAKP